MHITVEPRDDHAVLYLRGEFDTFYVPALQQEINALAKTGMHRLVLDLRFVKFINSTALGAIIKASKDATKAGGRLVISRPSPFCRDILEKIGLERVRADGYGFQIEMAYEVAKAGGRIVEIPITFRDRIRGESKMSPDIVTEALWLVTKWGMRDRWRRIRPGR